MPQTYQNSLEELLTPILSAPGLSFSQLSQAENSQAVIDQLLCPIFIKSLQGQNEQQTIMLGSGRESILVSIGFVLLTLAYKQVNRYPHLLTLIKEQFFKPGVLSELQKKQCTRIFSICHNLEIELISSATIDQFCQQNQEFMLGFNHILNKIIGDVDKSSLEPSLQKIKTKFQVDAKKIDTGSQPFQCWAFGVDKLTYILKEKFYLFVVSAFTANDRIVDADYSYDVKLEDDRDFVEGHAVIPEASEESTPQFKENQQSVKYRKKSHKNSFGGEFETSTYNQLSNLLNRSQIQQKKDHPKQGKKVLSVVLGLKEKKGRDWENVENYEMEEKAPEGVNIVTKQTQMTGSHIEGSQGRKWLSQSQIPQMPQNNPEGSSNIKKLQKIQTFAEMKKKEDFIKFSFSKKDSSKFIFKEIESEYNEEDPPEHHHFESSYSKPNPHIRSSLTILKSPTLLHDDECFKKRAKKSLLMEAEMAPIKEEMQSSQQEGQSVTQSMKEQDQMFEDPIITSPSKQSDKSSNKKESLWNPKQNRKSPTNHIQIFMAKNRKLSYLTEQLGQKKTSIWSANEEKKDHEEAFFTAQSPKNMNDQTFFKINREKRNRMSKPTKIHKNSQAITEFKHNKKRFEENSVSFSQIIANISQPEEYQFSGFSVPKIKKVASKMELTPKVYEFVKMPDFQFVEPEGWVRKEVTYYFGSNKHPQMTQRKPQKYAFEKVFEESKEGLPLKQKQSIKEGRENGLAFSEAAASQTSLPANEKKVLENSSSPSEQKPRTNIRSTIDTSKNGTMIQSSSNAVNQQGADQIGLNGAKINHQNNINESVSTPNLSSIQSYSVSSTFPIFPYTPYRPNHHHNLQTMSPVQNSEQSFRIASKSPNNYRQPALSVYHPHDPNYQYNGHQQSTLWNQVNIGISLSPHGNRNASPLLVGGDGMIGQNNTNRGTQRPSNTNFIAHPPSPMHAPIGYTVVSSPNFTVIKPKQS